MDVKKLPGLFIGFFRIAAFTLGGGLVMLPLMEDEFVRRRQWLTSDDFMGVLTLTNALPGVIAVNTSLIIGRKTAGLAGALAAFLGAILPSVVIILLLAPVISLIQTLPGVPAVFTSVRAAVAALILLLIIRQSRKMDFRDVIFAMTALLAARAAGIHPLLLIPAAAVAGVIVYRNEPSDKSGESV